MWAVYVQGVYKILTPHILQCALPKIRCSSTHNQMFSARMQERDVRASLVCVYNPYFRIHQQAAQYMRTIHVILFISCIHLTLRIS